MAETVLGFKIEIKGTDAQTSQLSKLSSEIEQMTARIKLLNTIQSNNNSLTDKQRQQRELLKTQLKASTTEYDNLNKKIIENNGQSSKSVGFIGKLSNSFKGMISKINVAAIAVDLMKDALISAVKIILEYDKANVALQSTLGATKVEMEKLSTQSKTLGIATGHSATEVVKLQTEFAKLGFPTADIIKLTESTLNAATAMGSDLASQAALTSRVIKSFGLDASKAAKVNDVLAASTSKTTLNFKKLQTALPIVGDSAKKAGIEMEELAALLGVLSDEGLDASTSAEALKDIFLDLSDKGLTFEDAMTQINNATDKNATAIQLFGEESANTAVILAETGGTIDNLKNSLNNSEGAAKNMAETMQDNLSGSLDKVSNAWDGFVLSLDDGDGVISKIIRGFARLATNMLLWGSGIEDVKKSQAELNEENINLLRSTNKNIKENEALINKYEELSKKENLNAAEKRELNSVTTRLISKFGASVTSINQETGALEINIAAVRKKILAEKALESDAAKTLLLEKSRLEQQVAFAEEANEKLDALGSRFSEAAKKGTFDLINAIKEARNLELTGGSIESLKRFNDQLSAVEPTLNRYASAITFAEGNQKKLNDINREFEDLGIDINALLDEQTTIISTNTDAKIDAASTTDAEVNSIKNLNIELAEQKKIRNEAVIGSKDFIDAEKEIIKLENELKEATGEAGKERVKITEEVNKKLINAGKTARQIEIADIEAQFEKEKALLLSGTPEQVKIAEDLERQKNLAVEKINKKFDDEEIKRSADVQNEISNAKLANIEDDVKREKDILAKKHTDELKALKKRLKDGAITKAEYRALEKELDAQQATEKDEKTAKEVEERKALLDAAMEVAGEIADVVVEAAREKEEEKFKKEIADFEIKEKSKLDAFDTNVKAQLDSFTGTESEKVALEKKLGKDREKLEASLAKERENIERAAFKRKKKIDTEAAIINGALAITSIIATSPDILKPIGPLFLAQVGGAAAMTIAAVAKIAGRKFNKGGLVDGPPHEQGGVQMLHKSGVHIGEMEGNEYIISAQRTREIGVDKLDALNFNGVSPSINGFFASGGQVPTFNSSSSTDNELGSQLNMEKLSELISTQMQDAIVRTPVINNATDTFSVAAEVINTENELSFGQ